MPDDNSPPVVNPADLGSGNQQALSDVVQAPTAQPALKSSALGGKNMPGIVRLIAGLVKPSTQETTGMTRPPSRMDDFEKFLGNFVGALGAGMANQGTGPASFSRGFGGAMQYPVQRAYQQQQLEQQQAQTQEQQARAQLEQAQAQTGTVYIPGIGQVTAPQSALGNILKGSGAASISGASRQAVAGVQAQNKLDAIRLQTSIIAQKGAKFIPDVGQDGRPFYHVMNPFGKEIGQTEVNTIPQLMARTSSTVEYKQQEDGSYVALPKTTTTRPVLPSGYSGSKFKVQAQSPQQQSASAPKRQFWATSQQGGVKAVPVMGPDGQPLMGKAPENIRTMAYTAKAALPHIPELLSEIDDMNKLGVLGQFQGKMTQALSQKRGFRLPGLSDQDMQKVGKFLNDVQLMDSAMLRTHFGARGGQQMYDKFSSMLNAGEDPSLVKGGLQSFSDYLTGYSQMGGMNKSTSVDSLVGKYK